MGGPLGQMMLMGPRVNMMKKIKLTEDLNTGPYRIMRRILILLPLSLRRCQLDRSLLKGHGRVLDSPLGEIIFTVAFIAFRTQWRGSSTNDSQY